MGQLVPVVEGLPPLPPIPIRRSSPRHRRAAGRGLTSRAARPGSRWSRPAVWSVLIVLIAILLRDPALGLRAGVRSRFPPPLRRVEPAGRPPPSRKRNRTLLAVLIVLLASRRRGRRLRCGADQSAAPKPQAVTPPRPPPRFPPRVRLRRLCDRYHRPPGAPRVRNKPLPRNDDAQQPYAHAGPRTLTVARRTGATPDAAASATRTQRTQPTRPEDVLVRNPLYDQRIASSDLRASRRGRCRPPREADERYLKPDDAAAWPRRIGARCEAAGYTLTTPPVLASTPARSRRPCGQGLKGYPVFYCPANQTDLLLGRARSREYGETLRLGWLLDRLPRVRATTSSGGSACSPRRTPADEDAAADQPPDRAAGRLLHGA